MTLLLLLGCVGRIGRVRGKRCRSVRPGHQTGRASSDVGGVRLHGLYPATCRSHRIGDLAGPNNGCQTYQFRGSVNVGVVKDVVCGRRRMSQLSTLDGTRQLGSIHRRGRDAVYRPQRRRQSRDSAARAADTGVQHSAAVGVATQRTCRVDCGVALRGCGLQLHVHLRRDGVEAFCDFCCGMAQYRQHSADNGAGAKGGRARHGGQRG